MDNHVSEAMRNGHPVTIDVKYRNIDGYHVFTSDDVYGLYVASRDPHKAFHGVAPTLEALLELNYGITDCPMEPGQDFADFIRARAPDHQPDRREVPPPVLRNHSYVMHCAAAA